MSNVLLSHYTHFKTHSGGSITVNGIFFSRCYIWGATMEYWFRNTLFCSKEWPLNRNFMYKGSSFNNHSCFLEIKLNYYSCGNLDTHFLRVVTIHEFDKRTDGWNSHS